MWSWPRSARPYRLPTPQSTQIFTACNPRPDILGAALTAQWQPLAFSIALDLADALLLSEEDGTMRATDVVRNLEKEILCF